jgi:cardiolipin synthase
MLTIQKAKKRLWIATPYFVPDTPLTRELELCTLRGVDVRLIIPKKSDNLLVHWVGSTYADKLRKAGVKVLFYDPGFMHQKVVLVDDDLALVGTTNFDNRALYLNFETTLAIHGADFARRVEAMLTIDMAESSAVGDPADKGPVSRFIRLQKENLSRLLAPLL